MRIDDKKHNSWLEVRSDQGYFKMDAQVRWSSLMEMYAISAVLLLVKILLWKKLRAKYLNWKASRIKYK